MFGYKADLPSYFQILRQLKVLTDTNRFLNQKLFQINDIYLEVFSIYRSTWFFMDNRLDSQIEWLLKDINKMLKNSYQKNDDNSHPFYFLYKAMDLQIEIILLLLIFIDYVIIGLRYTN